MILSEYIRGDMCDPEKDYVPSETYDKVLYELHRQSKRNGVKNKPVYLSCRTYRTYEEFTKYAQYAAGWNDAMKHIFGM